MNVYAYICDECGGEAFYVHRLPGEGETLDANDMVKADGSMPGDGEDIRCGECGSDPARYTGLQIGRLKGPMAL